MMKVGIIMGGQSDELIMQEAIKVLNEYEVPFETKIIGSVDIKKQMPEFAREAYSRGVRVVIAGTRGEADFSNAVASYFSIPTIGIPCRSLDSSNTLQSLFSILQQPNEFAVANVAFDSGQNAGILAVQVLALSNEVLQKKILAFKESLKNKILKANEELSQVKFENKTN